jgi:phage gpG-like protein
MLKIMEDTIKKATENLRIELAEHFDKNFSSGGFFGNKWKDKKDGSVSHLVKSGALRRSISSHVEGGVIIFTSSKPYATAHNEGVNKNVTAKSKKGKTFTRKMNLPQRQFIGYYKGIEKTVERAAKHAIEDELKKIIKNCKL